MSRGVARSHVRNIVCRSVGGEFIYASKTAQDIWSSFSDLSNGLNAV